MKLFWSVIGVFVLAAVAVLWLQAAESGSAERTAQSPRTPRPDSPDRASEIERTPTAAENRTNADDEETTDPPDRSNDADSAGDGLRDFFGGNGASTPSVDPKQELVDDLLNGDREEPPIAITRSGPAPGSEPGPGSGPGTGSPPIDGAEHAPPGQEAQQAENPWVDGEAPSNLEHSVEKRDDGTTVLDGMFEITGDGTASNPYEVTWDLLMSAAETYQPRLGMEEIPERIQMLDGKHIKITGHLLFPMASRQADEVLVMLNVWDGCCLGTMPSPYDAIEVDLKEPVDASGRQFMNYGTLEGRLNVDPYLINDWLIGLYIIEDGTLRMGSM